jgi:hypothetical protein
MGSRHVPQEILESPNAQRCTAISTLRETCAHSGTEKCEVASTVHVVVQRFFFFSFFTLQCKKVPASASHASASHASQSFSLNTRQQTLLGKTQILAL